MTTSNQMAESGADEITFDRETLAERAAYRRSQTRLSWTIRIVAAVIFAVGWQAASSLGLVNVNFISTPWGVVTRLVEMVQESATWSAVWSTFQAALIALGIGTFLGVLCGVVFHRIPTLARALNPFVTFFNALPRPALAPLFILWFGLGLQAKVVVGVSIVFFILLLNTMAGLATVDADIMLLTDSLGPNHLQRFWLVEFPSALPSIVAGLRLAAVYSVLGVVVSEIVASYNGLGVLLVQATNSFDITGSLAVLALMATCATVLDFAVRQIQRYVGDPARGAEL